MQVSWPLWSSVSHLASQPPLPWVRVMNHSNSHVSGEVWDHLQKRSYLLGKMLLHHPHLAELQSYSGEPPFLMWNKGEKKWRQKLVSLFKLLLSKIKLGEDFELTYCGIHLPLFRGLSGHLEGCSCGWICFHRRRMQAHSGGWGDALNNGAAFLGSRGDLRPWEQLSGGK